MSLRNEVFQTIPFDAFSDPSEPLIAAGDVEEEDHRLQGKVFSRFKFSYRLLGLLVGFFGNFSTLGGHFLVVIIWGEDAVIKTKTEIIFVIILLCSFLISAAIVFAILGFLRNLVAITYSAIGGRSKELLEEMVSDMECGFVVGALVGLSIGWPMAAILWGTRAQTMPMYSLATLLVVAFFWRKIMIMYCATKIKPSLSRRSAAEQNTV
jgi:hypothetical protein